MGGGIFFEKRFFLRHRIKKGGENLSLPKVNWGWVESKINFIIFFFPQHQILIIYVNGNFFKFLGRVRETQKTKILKF